MEKPLAYQGSEAYVFVCYAHDDAEAVYPEIFWLQAQGVNVWYDAGIGLGSEWTEALADAIQGCAKFLFFVTPRSVEREHCRRELNFAHSEGRDVLAVHLRETEVSGGLRLSLDNRQAIFKYEIGDDRYHQVLLQAIVGTTEPAPPSEKQASRRPRLLSYAAGVLMILAAAVAWWVASIEPDGSKPETNLADTIDQYQTLHNSIAVLPFENMSPDPEDAYFAAGIHEEVINQLVGIRDLSVISRTSVMQYAGVRKPIEEIARDLSVDTVMEGSVRFAGNRVRITAQLIDGQTGIHIWSKAYEDNLEDIFGIQLAIATQISQTLEAQFSPVERSRIGKQSTANPQAYAHYLRAVSGFGNYAPTGPLHEALDAAINLDPQFADALAFKAFLYSAEATTGYVFSPTYNADSQKNANALALEYAGRALNLDDSQARAHFAMQWAHALNREWAASQQSAARAYALNPNDYIVLNSAGWAAMERGDTELAIELVERSVALTPNDFSTRLNLAQLYGQMQRWEDSRTQAELVTIIAPDLIHGYGTLAQANAHLGNLEAVQTIAAKMTGLSAPPWVMAFQLAMLANTLITAGDSDAAARIIDQARAFESLDTHLVYFLAIRDSEGAITFIESALDEGFPWTIGRDLHFFSAHPFFDPIRAHPKFDELVKRAALPLK